MVNQMLPNDSPESDLLEVWRNVQGMKLQTFFPELVHWPKYIAFPQKSGVAWLPTDLSSPER